VNWVFTSSPLFSPLLSLKNRLGWVSRRVKLIPTLFYFTSVPGPSGPLPPPLFCVYKEGCWPAAYLSLRRTSVQRPHNPSLGMAGDPLSPKVVVSRPPPNPAQRTPPALRLAIASPHIRPTGKIPEVSAFPPLLSFDSSAVNGFFWPFFFSRPL